MEVHLVFRARDGLVFAAKTFKYLPNKWKHEEELSAWLTKIRREFTLMRDNPHVSYATATSRYLALYTHWTVAA